MTNRQMEAKEWVIEMMRSTAHCNGKNDTYLEMRHFAERLHRLEATLHRLAEEECMSETYDQAKQIRIEKLAENLIREHIGCECYTQRDPRGCAIRMYLVDWEGNKRFNTFDGETTALAW